MSNSYLKNLCLCGNLSDAFEPQRKGLEKTSIPQE
jgi:hypothetical protein